MANQKNPGKKITNQPRPADSLILDDDDHFDDIVETERQLQEAIENGTYGTYVYVEEEGDWYDNHFDEIVEMERQLEKFLRLPKLISAEDLLNEPDEPIKWLVENLIPQGNIIMLAAPPGNLKTYVALVLGVAVANGVPFLNRPTTKTRVLYVDQENPKVVIKDRMRRIGKSSNLQFWAWKEKAPSLIEGSDLYKELIEEPTLLIFDSLVRFHDSDENKSWEMKKVSAALREICRNEHVTVLVLHHAGKPSSRGESSNYRGSSEIAGGVDVVFKLTADKQNQKLVLECIKNRLIQEETIKISYRSDSTSFVLEDITEQEKDLSRKLEQKTLVDIKKLLTKEMKKTRKPLMKKDFTTLITKALEMTVAEARDKIEKGLGKYWIEAEGSCKTKRLYKPKPKE